MFLLLQSMATLWNWALGADIIGTIFFFFIAWTDDYSHLVVLINLICFGSNLLWAKMFTDLQRNEKTILFFLGLAVVSFVSTILACRAKPGPPKLDSDDEYEYVYEEDEDGDDDPAIKDKTKTD